MVDFLRTETDFIHAIHLREPLEPEEGEWAEGLVPLSRYPMDQVKANWEVIGDTANNWAVRMVIFSGDASLSVTNVHRDWKSEERRQIETVRFLEELIEPTGCEIDIIAGDFNDDSAVVNFFGGRGDIGADIGGDIDRRKDY
jgi:endonuclease/exonuclease/phosphatase family metal-dependent hydrolase